MKKIRASHCQDSAKQKTLPRHVDYKYHHQNQRRWKVQTEFQNENVLGHKNGDENGTPDLDTKLGTTCIEPEDEDIGCLYIYI